MNRFVKWAREWMSTPKRWRQYKQFLDMQDIWSEEHRRLASEMGYLGCHQLEAAVKIARRCAGAELALKRLAEASERELEEAGLPGLSPAQIERLALLAEECGEVVHAVGNVLRYGWQTHSPYGGPTNRVLVERKVGSLRSVAGLMIEAGDLRRGDIKCWERKSRETACAWMRHQG